MTTPKRPLEPAPLVELSGPARTGGGTPVVVRAIVTNQGRRSATMLVSALGVDPAWLPRPVRVAVEPGFSVPVDLVLTPAQGTLPARYPFSVAAQALDPQTDQVIAETALVEGELVVDAPGNLEVSIQPADASAVFRRRASVIVHNVGLTPADVNLEVRRAHSVDVELDDSRFVVDPGQVRRVRAKLKPPFRLFGRSVRHLYTITARSAGAPRHVEGALTGRALFGPLPLKLGILTLVLGTWITAAIVFIPKLSNNVQDRATNALNSLVPTTTTTSSGPAPGGSSGGGSGGGGGGGSSNGGGSGGGGGNGGSGGSGGSGGGSGGGGTAAGANSVRLSGTVGGVDPNDVNVSLQRTDLLDPAVQQAQGVGISTRSLREIGMVPASAVVVDTPRVGSGNRQMATKSDGAWSFAQVPAPGYYLVTFTKPGYQTQRFLVDSSTVAAGQPIKVDMQPGQGSLSGRVTGPHGAVGGAQITISDGTSTVTTTTNTKGDIGAWAVQGLTTPDTYLVSASADGLGLESKEVSLKGGGVATVNLTLKSGVAALTGTVTGRDASAQVSGIAGAQVTATNGTITRSTTTVTGSLAGAFRLPDLPAPGTYTITVQAEGFQTQTLVVTLAKGQSESRIDPQLMTTSATVGGNVVDSSNTAVAGAGLTLSSPQNTYKITTTDTGSFEFAGVVPGTYVLTVQYEGLKTQYKTVEAVAGMAKDDLDFTMADQPVTFEKASITGYIASATSPSGTLCTDPTVCTIKYELTRLDGNNTPVTTIDASPTQPLKPGPTKYTIKTTDNSLSPGEYRLRVSVTGFLASNVNVEVPLNAEASAPQVSLFPSNTIDGAITSDFPLSHDPNTETDPYSGSCVWAVPVGGTSGVDTSTCPSTEPNFSPCTDRGQAAPEYVDVNADGSYSLEGLCDGTYTVSAHVNNPYLLQPDPALSVPVAHGSEAKYSPKVSRLGRALLTLIDTATGATVSSGNVTAACIGTPSDPKPRPVNGKLQAVVYGLPTGQPVSCHASWTDGTGATETGSVTGITGSVDGDSGATINLSKPSTPAFGQLIRNDIDPNANPNVVPIANATVTITGVIGYNGTTANTSHVVVTTNANGCFGVLPAQKTAQDPTPSDLNTTNAPPDCFKNGATLDGTNVAVPLTDPSDSTSPATSFTSAQLTLTTSATGFNNLNGSVQTLGTKQQNTFAPAVIKLDPSPLKFLGTVELSPDAGTSTAAVLAGVTVSVVSEPFAAHVTGGSANTINCASGVTACLHLNDSHLGQDQLVPGTYKIKVSLTGYAIDPADSTDGTFTFTCTLGGTSCGPLSAGTSAITFEQSGSVSGTVTGFLTTDTTVADTNPATSAVKNQPIAFATVSLAKCTDSTCTSVATTSKKATTDANGHYNFDQIVQGTYQLTVAATGWHANVAPVAPNKAPDTVTTPVTVNASDLTPTKDVGMLIDLVTLKVTLTAGSAVYCSSALPCSPVPTVYLNAANDVTLAFPSVTAGTDGSFSFGPLIPTLDYWVVVREPQGTISVPNDLKASPVLATGQGTSQTVPVPITLASNTIQGGPLKGAKPSGSATDTLIGVPVTLGTGTTLANFRAAIGTNGQQLTTLTDNSGNFSFTTVPNGTYVALYNDPNAVDSTGASETNSSFQPQLSTDFAYVYGGLYFPSLAGATLSRASSNFSVKLVPSSGAGDDLSGAKVTLTSPDFTSAIQSGAAVAGTGGAQTFTFNAVTADDYTLHIELPAPHLGTVVAQTNSPALNACTVGTSTADVTCDSSSPIHVRNKPQSAAYDVNEYRIGLSVVATKLGLDSQATLPATTVSLSDGTNTSYSQSSFTVSTSTPSTDTAVVWGRGKSGASGAVTYKATAAVDTMNYPNWQGTSSVTLPTSDTSNVLAVTEFGAATITVHVTFGTANVPGAHVTISAPSGTNLSAPTPADTGTDGTVQFRNIPFSGTASWSVDVSASVTIAGVSTTVTGHGTFSVNSTNCTPTSCTIPTVNIATHT